MAIPESQLSTWSNIGATVTSSATYQTVKAALEHQSAPYAGKNFTVYLQGSYGNGTNIYSESDVDIVIELSETFSFDLSALPEYLQTSTLSGYPDASYRHADFKRDVIAHLEAKYGAAVTVGKRAVKVAGLHGRRYADVLVAIQHRRYFEYQGGVYYVSGLAFFDSAGTKVINYPKLHLSNCTEKNKETNGEFKPAARMFKNARSKMVERGFLADGQAPSYFIEGLLHNAPNAAFGGSWQDVYAQVIDWANSIDRSNLMCANKQHVLLTPNGSAVTWAKANCEAFLAAAVRLWKEWS